MFDEQSRGGSRGLTTPGSQRAMRPASADQSCPDAGVEAGVGAGDGAGADKGTGSGTFTDDKGTYEAIKALTNKYEGTETAAAFNALTDEYVMPMLKAIVGFTIEVESIDNTFKLSQNRDKASQINIIEQLKKRGDYNSAAIAVEMEKRL